MCLTKTPLSAHGPLQLHGDLTDAHCPSKHFKLDGSHVRRCCHAALLCRVLRKMHPLQSPPAASFPISLTQAVPVAVAVTSAYLSLVRSLTAHHRRYQVSKDRHSWVFHTTSLLKAAPARPHSHNGPSSTSPGTPTPPTSPPLPDSRRGQPHPSGNTYHSLCSYPQKRSASTAPAGTHSAIGCRPTCWSWSIPEAPAVVLPMVRFGFPKHARLGHIHNADSDLMHYQFRLSLPQWNPGPARRNPTNIIAAACGKFRASQCGQ